MNAEDASSAAGADVRRATANARTAVLLGEQSLLIQCGDAWHEHGHRIAAVVSGNPRILGWCSTHRIPTVGTFAELRDLPAAQDFDYLLSITNLKMVPTWLRTRPARMAINFHDGPLPRHAGLNAPVWALLADEPMHGITWHRMDEGADTGPIIAARQFPIAPDDTAFSLNARCYEAGLAAFHDLLVELDASEPRLLAQDFAQRSYHALAKRPAAAALLDWRQDASTLARLVRALDFGPYRNPVLLPRIDLGDEMLLARHAEIVGSDEAVAPGTLLDCCAQTLTVRCAQDALRITKASTLRGDDVDVAAHLRNHGLLPGSRLPLPDDGSSVDVDALDAWVAAHCPHEPAWTDRLRHAEPPDVPFSGRMGEATEQSSATPAWRHLPAYGGAAAAAQDDDAAIACRAAGTAAIALLISRLTGKDAFTLAAVPHTLAALPSALARFVLPVVPFNLRIDASATFATLLAACTAQWRKLETHASALTDLVAREPDLRTAQDIGSYPVRVLAVDVATEAHAREHAGAAMLTILLGRAGDIGLLANGTQLGAAGLDRLLACLQVLRAAARAAPETTCAALPLLAADDEARLVRFGGSTTAREHTLDDPDGMLGQTLTSLFEAQVARDPGRVACVFEGEALSYDALNRAANRLANHLIAGGTRPGELVGVMVERSLDMLVALYAVHKAGAAYVPLDPVYPQDRLAHMIDDAQLRTVITQQAFLPRVNVANPVVLDTLAGTLAQQRDTNPGVAHDDRELAYVIYTSGSTGKPKGVMVEHRQVVNFFLGMDRTLEPGPGTWLAVTSISFDISVLELFWTLARGFTVLLYADAVRQKTGAAHAGSNNALVSHAPAQALAGTTAARSLEFGFFYWNVAGEDAQHGADKYRLLLDGARFADENGFNAVWNPERHFETFGGLFPNPAVTAAALATITKRVALRAGSCVAPLHSPIRIAEEWAVVDNLSGGRAGVSIAAGWAPPDFAIRPENFANAKQVMFETADIVQRLWRGERVPFPGPNGEVQVRTLPRPLQPSLPIWVTTAGNIETFVQAGEKGMHLLTHLLGQTVEEVTDKVRAYRSAWARAGHPGRGTVTLMLHTFVGPSQAAVEDAVRGPMKAYLKSAMFLVKSAAWQFPTFKRMSEETGRSLDAFFADISEADLDDLLEFAFQRYFHDSGLFGTPEHCLRMVERTVDADVDEIACLIDFGIDTDVVLQHLPHLNTLRMAAQARYPNTAATAPAQAGTAASAAPVHNTNDDDHSLPALFARHQVTHFQCTPSMATMLVADESARPGLAALRQMMVGGEAFPPELARNLQALVGGRVTNMYGPTETTIWSTVGDVASGVDAPVNNVSIGRALPNQRVYVLDAQQKPLPPGIAGELVIAGEGVVRGYWERPDLTAERFVPDPAAAGARMYRTGDLARHLEDGRIECLGRVDHQVKIRGYRVELGEIEALLRGHARVREAAVLLREDVPGDKRLVAYLRTDDGSDVPADELKTWLRQQLPEFMVPSAFVVMQALPLTPNGKLDRKALPAPQLRALIAEAYTPPRNEAEALISDIWKRALGLPQVGTRENFFDIGGHSLLVVQVLKELRERIPKPIQMTDLFKHTTIEALANFLSGDSPAPQGSDRGKSRADARRAAMNRRRT